MTPSRALAARKRCRAGTDGTQPDADWARISRLGVPDKVIQSILRHSNVNMTVGYCIKPQTSDVIAAMDKFDAEIAARNLRGQ